MVVPGGRHVLVVENNPDDALIIQRAFRDVPTIGTCYVCRNLSEATSYLKGAGIYSDRVKYPKPDAIVSDFRLPDGTGGDLLRSFQQQNLLKGIPFCFLSGSATPTEFEKLTELKPAKIFRKPVGFTELCQMLSTLPEILDSVKGTLEQ
jgi:two-component system response regulator